MLPIGAVVRQTGIRVLQGSLPLQSTWTMQLQPSACRRNTTGRLAAPQVALALASKMKALLWLICSKYALSSLLQKPHHSELMQDQQTSRPYCVLSLIWSTLGPAGTCIVHGFKCAQPVCMMCMSQHGKAQGSVCILLLSKVFLVLLSVLVSNCCATVAFACPSPPPLLTH